MAKELEKEKDAYRGKAQNLYNKISSKMISEYEGKLERAKAEYVRQSFNNVQCALSKILNPDFRLINNYINVRADTLREGGGDLLKTPFFK